MLIGKKFRRSRRGPRESGQAAVFLVLAMGLFLIGSMGFVVDGANLWFHRQSAQTAADAACTAGAMNMLSVAAGANPPNPNWIGTSSFQCSGSTNSGGGNVPNTGFAPCQYAALNGYTSSGLQANKAGSDVSISFPGSFVSMPTCVTGLPPSPSLCAADDRVKDFAVAATPYMQVNVTDRVQTTFIGLLNGGKTVDVGAQAICGLSNVLAPVPVVALNPNAPTGVGISNTLGGPGNLSVLGAAKSIHVNSTDNNAVSLSGTIDLSTATSETGDGEFAVAGREAETDAGGLISAKWVNAAGVTSDPFATVSAPRTQGLRNCTNITDCVTYGAPPGTLGCPPGISCDAYQAGYYPTFQNCPNAINGHAAICVEKGQPNGIAAATGLAVFQPGIYYLGEDFYADPTTSCLRSATTGGDGSGGTMFYLARVAVLDVAAGSGTACASSMPPVSLSGTECPNNNLSLPSVTVTGNVLLAPCTGKYGDPLGANAVRGMLLFQERDVPPQNSATWSGSSSNPFALVGNIYLHNCILDQSGDSGANCDPNAFHETFNLGSNGYIVGGIVVDQLQINSGANINVVLNPTPQYYTLKASLLQ